MGDAHDDAFAGPTSAAATRSSRDKDVLRADLERWMATKLPADAKPTITEIAGTDTNGMSSETLLLHAEWTEDGQRVDHPMVARLAPDSHDVPVFPSYDLDVQFEVLEQVRELTDVPVPKMWWYEGDPSVVGTTFFTMERLDGIVPPDVMPYTFGDNWLYDASREDQQRLQDSTIAVVAELHGIDRPEERFAFLRGDDPGDTPLRRRFNRTKHWYEWVAADFMRSPVIDRTFRILDDHFPTDHGPTVLSWGDSRIGNVMYRDFEPVAVLDWEMVGLGPPELDLYWMAYAHDVFNDIASVFELPGMADFLRPEDAAATYEGLTGYAPRAAEWFMAYAAVQYAIVFLRTGQRAVHFGEEQLPADIDDIIRNRASLERTLAALAG